MPNCRSPWVERLMNHKISKLPKKKWRCARLAGCLCWIQDTQAGSDNVRLKAFCNLHYRHAIRWDIRLFEFNYLFTNPQAYNIWTSSRARSDSALYASNILLGSIRSRFYVGKQWLNERPTFIPSSSAPWLSAYPTQIQPPQCVIPSSYANHPSSSCDYAWTWLG